MIKDFIRDEKNGSVVWTVDGQVFSKKFSKKIQAELISDENRVLIVSDHNESGSQNVFIYDERGILLLRPKMPVLDKPVDGVHSVWFVPGKNLQKTILLSDAFSPYDTACTFNLSTAEFSDFCGSK